MTGAPHVTAAQHAAAARLRAAGDVFDADWYLDMYPDVARGALDPAVHYVCYGARLGRDPGPRFDTRYYLSAYPDLAGAGVLPALHYVDQGRAEGRVPTARQAAARDAEQRLAGLRDCLWGQGLEAPAVAELRRMADGDVPGRHRAIAAWEMAIWHLRRGRGAAARRRLLQARLDLAMEPGPPGDQLRLAVLEQVSFALDGNAPAARLARTQAMAAGGWGTDAELAHTWADPTPEARLARLGDALETSLALMPGQGPAFDRIETAAGVLSPAVEGACVTVLLAAHNAAMTLPTALRAIQAQTWTDLDIVVIDDASTDATADIAQAAARDDPRIRVLRQPVNRGAYCARNAGLAVARGHYVTLMDADDWVHPARIETQIAYLETHSDIVACTTPQVRVQDDLTCGRWTGRGDMTGDCAASVMVRRQALTEHLGQWDDVRVSADRELMRRLVTLFGAQALTVLGGRPLTLQRDGTGSAVRDPVTGIIGEVAGARREYREAQLFHHAAAPAEGLRYDGQARPFAAPGPILPERAPAGRFDRIVAGDFRRPGPALDAALAACDGVGQGRLGLVLLRRFAPEVPDRIDPDLRARIDGHRVRMLVRGDVAHADVLHVPDAADAEWPQTFVPQLSADRIDGDPGAAITLAPQERATP
ncbi:glycosyltransferase family 2 protein [Jannaschia sp. 2305UL9-9]|uniref:glycosyltransferase family 2 protein n=1 Tax=Jannaschia sp. 2305UL9-9 TaxID=3121638 RepID=UPI003527CCC7